MSAAGACSQNQKNRPKPKESDLRRKIIILAALFTLAAGATAAYGATAVNTYSGTTQSFSKGAGSKKKPVGTSFKQTLVANNTDPTKAAAVLVNIKVKIYGLVSNAKQFPTCSNTKMVQLKSDSFCPKASKFASGLVNSLLGDPSLSASNRVKCNPNLDVFNAGKGKLWFFFTTHSTLQCAGLTTGSTAPYPGTISQQGAEARLRAAMRPSLVARHQRHRRHPSHQPRTRAALRGRDRAHRERSPLGYTNLEYDLGRGRARSPRRPRGQAALPASPAPKPPSSSTTTPRRRC